MDFDVYDLSSWKNTFFNAFITNTVAHAEHFTTSSLYKDSCISTIRRRDRCDSQTLSADRWRGCAFWQSAEWPCRRDLPGTGRGILMARVRRWVRSRPGREDPGTEVSQAAQPLSAETNPKTEREIEEQRVRENLSSSEKNRRVHPQMEKEIWFLTVDSHMGF